MEDLNISIGNDWDEKLKEEFKMPYFIELTDFLQREYETQVVYPPKNRLFSAFKECSFENTKVVILGQDPYHQVNQAHGLAFSVNEGVIIPPSLRNIYKELHSDLDIKPSLNGCLKNWAKEGVLLLNATLSVRDSRPQSHKNHGWESFTDKVIKLLDEKSDPIVFILWGKNARDKIQLIKNKKHLILVGAHPSPLSANRGFFGGKYFSRANSFLNEVGKKPINWQINR